MNRDTKILAVVVLLLVAATAFFMNMSGGPSSTSDPDSLNPNGRSTEEVKKPSRFDVTKKEVVDSTKAKQAPREAPPEEIKTLDDLGQRHAALDVTIFTQSGETLQDVKIELFAKFRSKLAGDRRGEMLRSVLTDQDGHNRIQDIEAKFAYALHVSAPGYCRIQVPHLTFRQGEVNRQQFTLWPGATLIGRVISEVTLNPIPGATIAVYDLEDVSTDPESSIEATALAGADGKFEVANLRIGPKRICVSAEGFGGRTKPYFNVKPQSSEAELEFKLPPGAAISGIVMDTEGKRLANAKVTIAPMRGSTIGDSAAWYAAVLTNASGQFKCDGLLPGHYVLRASKNGYAPGNYGAGNGVKMRISAANAAAGDNGVKLFLGEAPKASGQVVDSRDGQPVRIFDVYASTSADPSEFDPSTRQRFMSDDGKFEYAFSVVGGASRVIYLHVEAPGFAGGKTRLDFSDPDRPRAQLLTRLEGVKIKMAYGVSIVGRISDSAGRPVSGVRVSARRRTSGHMNENVSIRLTGSARPWSKPIVAKTDAQGRYEIRAIPNGEFQIRAEHPDLADLLLEEKLVVIGEDIDLGESTMTIGGEISGIVLDSEGNPAGSTRVLLEPRERDQGKSHEWRTNLSGRFHFKHVAAGSFRLIVIERRGLDTRSAIYQELMNRKPDVEEIEMKDGLTLKFELRN